MNNPFEGFDYSSMREGDVRTLQISDDHWIAVKKQETEVNGKRLKYNIKEGKTKEEALSKLS